MIKGVTQTIEDETKRFGFCSMMLGTLGAILLKGLGFKYAVATLGTILLKGLCFIVGC